MKKWKIIRIITSIIFIIFIICLVIDIINCMSMTYPHPALGIDVYNWFDQFKIDMFFFMYVFGIPILIDIILMIISFIKINKLKNGKVNKDESNNN